MVPSKFVKLKHPVLGILIRSNLQNNEEDRFGSNACILQAWKPVVFMGRCFGAISRNDILDHGQGRYQFR